MNNELKYLKNKQQDIVPVVFCTDNNYFDICCVAINSVIKNTNPYNNYEIYIFHDDEFNLANINRIKNKHKNITIKFLNVNKNINKKELYSKAHFTKTMYYRWLIPELLPQFDKIIYLDCDLVMTSDIAELLKFDIKTPIGAVVDPASSSMKFYIEDLLEVSVSRYVNSGVLLFNVQSFNSGNFKDKCFNIIRKNKCLVCPDQDALNIALKDNITLLPIEWNFQVGNPEMLKLNIEEAHIYHFTSANKPWNSNFGKYNDLFWKYVEDIDIKRTTKTAKKRNKFLAFVATPFRLIIKFFKVWKCFGFKKAIKLTKNKIKHN